MNTAAELTLLVGTYTDPGRGAGIARVRLDCRSGALRDEGLACALDNPSWVLVDSAHGRVFSISETPGNPRVHWLQPHGDGLRVVHSLPAGGELPCHLCRWRDELVATCYGDGAVLRVALGADRFGAARVVRHVGASVHPRQQGPHAHGAFDTRGGLLVTDLGCDVVFRHDAGDEPQRWLELPPGCGPRMLAADGQHCYIVGELDNCLHVAVGRRLVATAALLPDDAGDSSAGHVAMLPGARLLASNRGHDSLVMFDVGVPRAPRLLGHWPAGGGHPRHFLVTPDGRWVVVANRDSDNLVVFAVTDAGLERHGELAGIGSPVCVAAWR